MKIRDMFGKIKQIKVFKMNVDEKLKFLDKSRGLLTNIFIIAVVLIVFVSSFYQFRSKQVILLPINSPKKLTDQGYDGATSTNLMLGKLNQIRYRARTNLPASFMSSLNDREVDIEVEGISLRKIIRYIKGYIGDKDIYVRGSIYQDSDKYVFVVLVDGREIATLSNSHAKLDDLMQAAAEKVMEVTSPYILARYYSNADEPDYEKVSTQVINVLAHPPKDDDYWAINLLGNTLYNQERFAEAEGKYREAFQLAKSHGNDFVVAQANLAAAILHQEKLDEAENLINQAIEKDPEYYYSYFVKGMIFDYQHNSQESIKWLQKSLDKNPLDADSYYQLARVYWDDFNDGYKAREYLEISIALYNEFGYPGRAVRSIYWIGDIYESESEFKKELQLYEKAIIKYANAKYLNLIKTRLAEIRSFVDE